MAGTVRLLPDMFDRILRTTAWLDVIVAEEDGTVTIELPPFGQPIILY